MKPVWKWIIGAAAGVVVLVAVANRYINHTLKPKVAAELTARIAESTDGRYELTYNLLEISLLAGNATAMDVRLRPTTPPDAGGRPAASYDIRVGRLAVRGVGLLRLLVTGNLHVNTITVDTPSVRITRYAQADTADVDTAQQSWRMRLAGMRQVDGTAVGKVVVRAGELELLDDQRAGRLHTRQINATVWDIRIDSASLGDTARIYGAGAARVQAATVAYTRPDSLYQLHTGPIRLETEQRKLVLDDLRYGLTVSRAEFYRRVQKAEDIGDIAISRIGLRGMDFGRWMATRTIAAEAVHLDSGHIAVYKDKTQPNPPENKIGRSPHQLLLQMDQRIAIDSVFVDAVDIRFTEVSDQTGEAGTVTFDATAAVIHHVTNDSLELARNRFMRLHARSRAMGTGDLTVDFRFDLLDSLGAHTYTAEVGAMEAAAFNRMLTPQLRVEIETGTISRLRFDMEANDRRTAGTLQLDYNQLKVNMLKENRDGGTSTNAIVSFFANRFLLNDSNPDANGVHHTGRVYIERPYSFSFFKMIWRSIREGTKQCIGMGAG